MSAVKAANPKSIFTAPDWASITTVSNWREIWLIVHAYDSDSDGMERRVIMAMSLSSRRDRGA
jgi:hypothetical protein